MEERGERVLIAAAALLVVLCVSLWVTVPAVVGRRLREGESQTLSTELEARRVEWSRASDTLRAIRTRAMGSGDLLNRIAFLYSMTAGQWPRVLNPERGILGSSPADRLADALGLYVRGLEHGRALLAARETEDPDLPVRVPAVSPIRGALFEPSAYFGPRKSTWTGEEEFFLGVDLAAPEGSAVIATGSGTVAFAGTVRRSVGGWFWRLGNVVVLSHGGSGATVFGHLATIEVRRGQHVARGDRLGTVGSTGWAISSQLHYEYWRPQGDKLFPTDPLFTTLDGRLGRGMVSLEQMEAASAPGPLDPVPGVQIAADRVGGPPQKHPAARPPRAPRRRRV